MDSTCNKEASLACSEVTIIRKRPPSVKPYPSLFTLLIFCTLSLIYYFSRLLPWESQIQAGIYVDDSFYFAPMKPQTGSNITQKVSTTGGSLTIKPKGKRQSCQIPHVPLYSAAYNHSKIVRPWVPMLENCAKAVQFTELKDGVLYLTDVKMQDCCVREISRKPKDWKDWFMLSQCMHFKNRKLDVSKLGIIEVSCFKMLNRKRKEFYNYHANVPLTKGLKSKAKFWAKQAKAGVALPPNVMVIVIDSTARSDFYRSLPKTTKFMRERLGFIEFKGHHPMGEATMRNAIAMLVGVHLENFTKQYHRSWKQYWGNTPFIWNEFDRLNYATGYLEDLPGIGTWNYGGQQGFIEQPTDLYFRPLGLAHQRKFSHSKEVKICLGKRTFLQVMLDYKLLALKTLQKTVPSFIISWPCWPQHDFERSLRLEDSSYLQFFTTLSKEAEILRNTWLIVTADHGFYGGEYASTHEGLLDRRSLPLFIRPPDAALIEEPGLLETLQWNSKRVTGHFDFYRTLIDLAGRANVKERNSVKGNSLHGQSLLTKLEKDRTCAEAGIIKQMCACNLPPPGTAVNIRKLEIRKTIMWKMLKCGKETCLRNKL